MTTRAGLALGLDFGTESVRALLVGLDGVQHASGVSRYAHGQIVERLPRGEAPLPANFALQNPDDWLDSSARAVRRALQDAGAAAEDVISIGVDFTSCTMLPALADGTPVCKLPEFAQEQHAWPKLWKHHAAQPQTDRINLVARRRQEPWLARYGGAVGLEWFFPKALETLEEAPSVYEAAEVWLEAGDWYVWRLVGGSAENLPRSTCQAGYKALWHADDGYPSREFLQAVHPELPSLVESKMPGRLTPPGQLAGELRPDMASRLGLAAGTPVSAAVIDAHAGVPGAGVAEAGTLVAVLGTSSCHMLNATVERLAPGAGGRGQRRHSARLLWLRNGTGRRRRRLRLVPPPDGPPGLRRPEPRSRLRARRRRGRGLSRLVQRLPHATHERRPLRRVGGIDARPRRRRRLPLAAGSLRVRAAVDRRVAHRQRRCRSSGLSPPAVCRTTIRCWRRFTPTCWANRSRFPHRNKGPPWARRFSAYWPPARPVPASSPPPKRSAPWRNPTATATQPSTSQTARCKKPTKTPTGATANWPRRRQAGSRRRKATHSTSVGR